MPEGVHFASNHDDITFSKFLYLPGWKLRKYVVTVGTIEANLIQDCQELDIKKQLTLITLYCERTDPSVMVNILLTLILILYLSLLTFSSKEDSVLVVSVSIVALIGYRVVIQSMAPSHISYFMLSDYLYLITLSSAILTLLAGIYVTNYNLDITKQKWIIIGIYGIFVGASSLMSLIL